MIQGGAVATGMYLQAMLQQSRNQSRGSDVSYPQQLSQTFDAIYSQVSSRGRSSDKPSPSKHTNAETESVTSMSLFNEAYVVTFGSPLVLHVPRVNMGMGNQRSTASMIKQEETMRGLAANIHNVVYQLDVVPRLLGQHALPQVVTDSSLGTYATRLLDMGGVKRHEYVPFGHYYSLRQEHWHIGMSDAQRSYASQLSSLVRSRWDDEISILTPVTREGAPACQTAYAYDPTSISASLNLPHDCHARMLTEITLEDDAVHDTVLKFLGLFPDTAQDITFAIVNDHSMGTTAKAMRALDDSMF
jgi:hypothetical protein